MLSMGFGEPGQYFIGISIWGLHEFQSHWGSDSQVNTLFNLSQASEIEIPAGGEYDPKVSL